MPNKEIVLPLVSIIIPSYNKAGYLIEMINCILQQTYKNWELIIVDDGSDEDNIQKVNDFIREESRCKFVRRNREPKNGDTCRNIGMEISKGEYIIIFDADDLISSECIGNRVRYMQEHPDCDYASFPYCVFFDGENTPSNKPQKFRNDITQDKILSSLLEFDYPFTVWSNIYRRSSIQSIRWDEKVFVYQDFDFMVQCALAKLRHEYGTSYTDYYYRQFLDGSNVCGNFISKQKCESTLYLFRKTLEDIKQLDDYDIKKEQFKGMIVTHFERLLFGDNREDIKAYIELCQEYYDDQFLGKLKKVTEKCNKTNSKLKKIYAYYHLYRTFHHPRHRVLLMMSIKSLFR